MYLLPKIHKRLDNVPGHPFKLWNTNRKSFWISRLLHPQPITKSGLSYIKDTNDFLSKIKNLGKIPENEFVTADAVGL